ncbi:MAG: ABC transporter ATP-binding protein [Proteobacteria bacterium]|nr:ABC transporter ATP-binding protein [Pseudomonadota bacterium]
MKAIEAVQISARFSSRTVFHSVEFSLQRGELVGVIGPNGAGKSTLLRILANLRQPDSGQVQFFGRAARDWKPRDLARRIAYLAQDGPVHWPMNVGALVSLGRLPHRRFFSGESNADRAAIERAQAATDITTLRHRTMREISAGERMRVLLARALAVDASVLLADEPVAALDPQHQLAAMELLRTLARHDRGVIVVLHDLSLASRFCDRLVLLYDAGIYAQGRPNHVLGDEFMAAAFNIEVARGERDGRQFLVPWQHYRARPEDR